MRYDKQIKFAKKLLITVVLLIVLILGARYFFISSYHVSTSSMEDALYIGDRILVNKWENKPEIKDIVLFSVPLHEESKAHSLLLSRCLGMPGDSIQINDNGYLINGKAYPFSLHTLSTYYVRNHVAQQILDIIEKLNIPLRNLSNEEENISLRLTFLEESMIREELPGGAVHLLTKEQVSIYSLVVPKKNHYYQLDEKNLMACKEIILSEVGNRAVFRDGKLYLDGKETTSFLFKKDYYWLLSDNTDEAIDSRYLGFISSKNILGTVWFCWMGETRERIFRWVD